MSHDLRVQVGLQTKRSARVQRQTSLYMPLDKHLVNFLSRTLVACNFLPRFYAASGRRVLPVTLSHHHKPFGSARIARGLRAPDLVGAAPRTVARTSESARWAREKKEASIRRIGELYTTRHTSVFRAAREG